MTPFGARLRELRADKGVSQKEMAAALDISPAYLSALEHGRRGVPTFAFVQRVIGYFNVIWDDAEELEQLAFANAPVARIDTAGLSPEATELANLAAQAIPLMTQDEIAEAAQAMRKAILRAGALKRKVVSQRAG
ncbi:MAG TPA: helix-turn-helix transcriptional regulator [Rhizobiaceae bacterium]|nr:helix-turn-helix transcriptional regulator [Rhizobiaceae bacterium]